MASRALQVTVVGATGAVGRALLQALEESDLPVGRATLLAGERSAGAELEFRGDEVRVEALAPPGPDAAAPANGAGGAGAPGPFAGQDLVFLAAGASVARAWARRAAAAGCAVIDLGPAFRADPEVPLVLPEVNLDALAGFTRRRLVATPGAAATQLALALAPLHRAAGVDRAVVTTVEPASAGGQRGVDELEAELRAMLSFAEPPVPTLLPHRLAFNVVPQAGGFDAGGEADEERAVALEVRRLLGSSLRIVSTHLRVPVFHGCLQTVALCTHRPLPAAEARALLRAAPGVKLLDAPAEGIYPMPMLAMNDDAALVGRVRDDPTQENGLVLVIAADNLRRGAATAAVEVARALVARGLGGGAPLAGG